MKKIMARIYHAPILYILLAIIFLVSLPSFNIDSESNTLAVVSGLGIDKSEDEIIVTVLLRAPVPNQSFAEKYKVVSSKDKSIAKALDVIGLHLGKEMFLAHAQAVIVNNELVEEDIYPIIEYLNKTYQLGNRTILVCTNKKAKEVLELSAKETEKSGIGIEEIVYRNDKYNYAKESSIETFYNGVFSPTRSYLMGRVDLKEEDTEGIKVEEGGGGESGGGEQESGGGSGGGGGGSSQSKPNIISNNGDTALFVDAKRVRDLSSKEVQGLNWVLPHSENGMFSVENVTEGEYNNATFNFSFKNKQERARVYFENGKPVVKYSVGLVLVLESISEENSPKIHNTQEFKITKLIKNKIDNKIKNEFSDALQIIKQYNADVLDVHEIFMQQAPHEFNKFLNSLEDKNSYLSEIMFLMDIQLFLNI